VMGTKLCRVNSDGTNTVLGDVGAGGQVTMDYSFDRLAVVSGGRLYYWNGSALSQVTDPDLGAAKSVCWVDGYFMTTDGEYLVVTELNDPMAVNPLKYGSSEADPDPVQCLVKVRNEVFALNRHTIEVFDNVGGQGFPFARIEGAQVQKGAIGPNAACQFIGAVAFLGSGRNETAGIYIAANANAVKLSTGEIDYLLKSYSDAQLAEVVLESVVDESHQWLFVHLPDRTLVYDAAASAVLQQPVWFTLTTSVAGFQRYQAKDAVWCYGQWLVGHPTDGTYGHWDDSISSHWGSVVRWEFGTLIMYNEGRGAIIHELELVALTGNVAMGAEPTLSTSYSVDGETWSIPQFRSFGANGALAKRIAWLRQGFMRHWRIQRFQGDSTAHGSFARLEVRVEPLNA